MTEPLIITDSSMMAGLFSNSSLLAEALNISSRRVYQLVDEGVLEKDGAKFDFVKCLQKYIAYIQSLTPVFADAEEELQQQQIRLTKARADKTEVEALLVRKEAVLINDVVKNWSDLVVEIRARLLTIPQRATLRIVGETDDKKIKEILSEEVKEALTRLSTEPLLNGLNNA